MMPIFFGPVMVIDTSKILAQEYRALQDYINILVKLELIDFIDVNVLNSFCKLNPARLPIPGVYSRLVV